MRSRGFAGRIVLALFLLTPPGLAQQSYVLENALARYEFRYDTTTGEVWLHEGYLKSDPSRVVRFAQTSLWDCELRVDPNALAGIDPARAKITEVSTLVSFSGPLPFASGTGVKFVWLFTLAADPGLSEPDPQVSLSSSWQLEGSRDYLLARAGYSLDNPAATTYRVWAVRHPRLAIHNLDATGAGDDRLLTSLSGGLLHGNPIRYVDPYDPLGRGFRFAGPTEPADGAESVFNVDPGLHSVPLTYYYHPSHSGPGAPLGLYLANDDDLGIVKGVHIVPENNAAGAPMGLLHYEAVQYPPEATTSIFDAEILRAHFNVHVGVVHGDWVDAAKKYRAYRTTTQDQHLDGSVRFPWLKTDDRGTPDPSDDEVPRPSGHPQNAHVPTAMKQSPLHLKLDPGFRGAYCVGELDLEAVEADFHEFFEPFFLGPGEVFPYLLLDRFQVTYDEVAYAGTGGLYRPRTSGVMSQVHQFVQDLGNAGHGVLLDSMTERFWITDNTPVICQTFDDCLDEDGSTYSWCCAIEDKTGVDSELRRLTWESQQYFRPLRSAGASGFPCPVGKHAALGVEPTFCATPPTAGSPPPGTRWPPVFEDIVSQAIQYLGIQGGMRFNSVPSSATACFSEAHDHPAGFSNATISGWFTIMDNVRAKAGRGPAFFVTKEYGDTTVARQVRVQNPLALDIAEDLLNKVVLQTYPESEWNRYFDAPVVRVPLSQMVADEIRFVSQYKKDTLDLPWTDLRPIAGRDLDGDGVLENRHFFRRFPAVTGALQCWSMSKRALVHQGGVLLSNTNMVFPSHFTRVPASPEDRALQGMADFYRGLARFLQGTGLDGKTNMEFATGTMERSPVLRILGETERFSIPRSLIEDPSSPFPRLKRYLQSSYGDGVTFFPAGADLAFDAYRPAYDELFSLEQTTNAAVQLLPDEHESWLPHGMYRHWDGSDTLALLIANPWGVQHPLGSRARQVPAVAPETRPMNPFTFTFLDPASSPASNTYTYEFDFDPAHYEISPAQSYRVERRTYDLAGTLLSTDSLGSFTGLQTFQGTLADFHFEAWYLTTAP